MDPAVADTCSSESLEAVAEHHPADEPETAALSKRARKRLLKQQEWEKNKADRRLQAKQRKKAKVEALKKENKFEQTYSAHRKRLKQVKMTDSACRMSVVLDMSYEDLMSDKDLNKCLKQVMHCYSINRRLTNPLQLHICNLAGKTAQLMTKHQGYQNWDCHMHELPLLEVFDTVCKDNFIYLTSESDNVLHTLEPDKVYIIGALVDHNAHKGLCHRIAQQQGLGHARLPIDQFVQLNARKVLTIDHVFAILAQVASGDQTWKQAFLSVIPERKGVRERTPDPEPCSSDHEQDSDLIK